MDELQHTDPVVFVAGNVSVACLSRKVRALEQRRTHPALLQGTVSNHDRHRVSSATAVRITAPVAAFERNLR